MSEQDHYESHLGGKPDLSGAPSTLPLGSGSEVDRYGSHFSIGSDGLQQIKKAAGSMQGLRAEQDVHSSHFGGLDAQKVREAAETMFKGASGAEQDRHASHFGLGHDGIAQVKKLAGVKGVGAAQVCFSRYRW